MHQQSRFCRFCQRVKVEDAGVSTYTLHVALANKAQAA